MRGRREINFFSSTNIVFLEKSIKKSCRTSSNNSLIGIHDMLSEKDPCLLIDLAERGASIIPSAATLRISAGQCENIAYILGSHAFARLRIIETCDHLSRINDHPRLPLGIRWKISLILPLTKYTSSPNTSAKYGRANHQFILEELRL